MYLCPKSGNGQTAVLAPDILEQKIDRLMMAYTGTDRPGAVIGIVEDGRFVFKKGYGMANLKLRQPNRPEVAFKIASLSKQFTAAAIVSLIQQRKLNASDDIRKYLPAFPVYDKVITINDLLYHTSGIRDYMVIMWLTGMSFENKFTNQDALHLIYRQSKLHFPTGTRCVYSNSNYILLAELLKVVTGKELDEYCRTELFLPLGMQQTAFNGSIHPRKVTTALSYYYGSGYRAFKNDNSVSGDGGIITTIDDLLQWDNTFYDTGSLARQLIVTGQLHDGKPLTYGMGIMTGTYRGLQIQFHPGAFLGYRAEMLRFPQKKISIICLGNTEGINPEKLTRNIADLYLFGQIENKEQLSLAPEEITAVVGRYEVARNVFVDIRFEDNVLTGQVTGQPKQSLSFLERNVFSIKGSNDTAVFSLPSNGKMQQLTVIQKQGRTIAKRPEIVNNPAMDKYTGRYFSKEQNAFYTFFIKKGQLYFRAGNSTEPVKAEVLKNYNRLYFGYQNLEQATIDFEVAANGTISAFTLNSGRVSGLRFVKQ